MERDSSESADIEIDDDTGREVHFGFLTGRFVAEWKFFRKRGTRKPFEYWQYDERFLMLGSNS